MKKPDSVVMIPGNIDSFFRKWFEFLEPFHKLTAREMDVAAALLKYNISAFKADIYYGEDIHPRKEYPDDK